jgi:hypothetical protein
MKTMGFFSLPEKKNEYTKYEQEKVVREKTITR